MSKRDMTIKEFCEEYEACREGRAWAIANCATMYEAFMTARYDWTLWIITRPGVVDDKALRLFACWCVRQVWHLLTDERSRNAVVVAERYARGEASAQELAAAWAAARDAAGDAARDAARVAVWSAARVAVWSAARDTALAATRDAAAAATRDATRGAAWDAVRGSQLAYIREHITPCFARVWAK